MDQFYNTHRRVSINKTADGDVRVKFPEFKNKCKCGKTTKNDVRQEYPEISNRQKRLIAKVKDIGLELMDTFDESRPSRELSIAKTKVEEAIMWAVKGISSK